MSLNLSAGIPVTTTATTAGAVPAGVCDVVLTNTGSTNVIYVGTKNTITTGTGFPIPAGATITFHGYPGSAGAPLYVIAAATGNNLGVLISTAS